MTYSSHLKYFASFLSIAIFITISNFVIGNGDPRYKIYYAFLLSIPAAAVITFIIYKMEEKRNFQIIAKIIKKYFPEYPDPKNKLFFFRSINSSEQILRNIDDALKEIQKINQKLLLDRELFLSLLNGLNEGVFCVETNGRIVFQNNMLDPELISPDAVGKPFFQAIRNSDVLEMVYSLLDQIENSSSRKTTSDAPEKMEFQTSSKYYGMLAQPVSTKNKTELLLIMISDETQYRLAEKNRTDFLMDASHELKTPITSIRGYTETLKEKNKDEREKKFIDAILRNIYRMERIIEDMTSISSFDSRHYPFNPVMINITDFMESLKDLVTGLLKTKNQNLIITADKFAPNMLMADQLLLEHLMLNLLNNASRHSPQDSIIRIHLSGINGERLMIRIIDSGPGINPDQAEKIFERFFRSDKNRTRVEGGTGLGLSIAKRIVLMHGGSIHAKNDSNGGGAVFTLVFKSHEDQKPSESD